MDDNSSAQGARWTTLGAPGRNTYRVNETTVDMRRPPRQNQSVSLSAQPQDLLIDLARTALIVIDMQNDFCAKDGWVGSMGTDVGPAQALVEPINRVADAFRAHGAPVLWVNWGVRPDRLNLSPGALHPFNPNGMRPGLGGEFGGPRGSHKLLEKDSWGAAIVDGLGVAPEDVRVDKHRISGFWDTPLDAILRNLDVSTLMFAGVNTDHCVLSTLMDANFHGYDTILLEDCTATTSPDFCFRAALHNVRFCFGFTTTSKQVVAALA